MSYGSYGYGNWPPPPRSAQRRRSSGLARLVWVLVLLAGFGVVASIVLNVLSNALGTVSQGVPQPGLGRSQPDDNESGSQPGLELPASAAAVLQQNALYSAGAPGAVDCPAPRLTSSSAQAQEEYDERVFDCLNRAWRGVLGDAGFSTTDPELFVFNESGSSPCGTFEPATGRILAFYCPVNRTMYADAEQMARSFPARDHVVYALVLAHEYGHHLQNVAGILQAESRVGYDQPQRASELSRRTEVQASCFAGIFIRSIEDSYPVTGNQRSAFEFYAFRAFGDSDDAPGEERTHGTSRTQGMWIARGFNEAGNTACNSFTASPNDVE